MHAYVRRRRYSKPVQRQTLSIRLDAGAPVNSKLTLEMSVHYENLFVAHGCMFRLRWQLPVSCDQYHGKQDRLPISRTGTRTGRRAQHVSLPTLDVVERVCAEAITVSGSSPPS